MSIEKIDLHYHQQLSTLIDGELAPDQARFLLRRLQHDEELAACVGRWQMLGDVLRGNAMAPAPEGFAARVGAAVAAEAPAAGVPRKAQYGRRAMWGGGAIAASVAAVAFFMASPQVPDDGNVLQSPLVATQVAAPDPVSTGEAGALDADASAAAMTAATGVLPAPANPARRSATRTRQAARSAAIASRAPARAVGNALPPTIDSFAVSPPDTTNGNPFANVRLDAPVARPWPRTVLRNYSNGAFNAAYPVDRAAHEFYPFDPRPPAAAPLTPPVAGAGEDQ